MKTSTFSFTLFLPLFILFFTLNATTTNKNIIPQTCKKCAQNDPKINYKFCLTSLQESPKSHCADLGELGLISIKLLRHNVTKTRQHIKHLLNYKNLDPFVRACLGDCLELYSDAIPSIKQAINNYKSKHYYDANFEVSSVIDASTTCEDGFNERKRIVSPLTKRNNETFQLAAIALSIINMLNVH